MLSQLALNASISDEARHDGAVVVIGVSCLDNIPLDCIPLQEGRNPSKALHQVLVLVDVARTARAQLPLFDKLVDYVIVVFCQDGLRRDGAAAAESCSRLTKNSFAA